MVLPTAAARLVSPAGSALSLMPDLLRTATCTVNLAAVAAAADEYLSPAASAQEKPGRPFSRLRRIAAWTPSATGGIMPRHVCSAPCGARRRTRAWQFRSAPCLPIGRLSSHHCALDIRRSAPRPSVRRRQACGYVDNASALPTYPQAQQTTVSTKVDCFEGGPRRPCPSPRRLPAQDVRSPHPADCAIFARIQTAIHKGWPRLPLDRRLRLCHAKSNCIPRERP